ncbi:U6 snRNA phosphodiesterase Usb1 [Hysterangium stoloniferum]|nr:U6 snRNA phosphodiesterase Usb1 [Hysterangium stoloniferum]
MQILVEYESSDEEYHSPLVSESSILPQSPIIQQKRKLPSLPSSLIIKTPISDPAQHQGRVRTQPHMDGQFACYVYVPITLESGGFGRLIKRALKYAIRVEPAVHPIIEDWGSQKGQDIDGELHISLTRPVYLQHHQREGFKRAVMKVAASHSPFPASFATFATFDNDEKTRAFLALEIGAGHSQLRQMTESITPTLRSLYQKEYYTEPRFHASIAWALLDPTSQTQLVSTPEVLADSDVELLSASQPSSDSTFITVPEFPREILSTFNDKLGDRLRDVGIFDVTTIKVRIGREVSTYALRGK